MVADRFLGKSVVNTKRKRVLYLAAISAILGAVGIAFAAGGPSHYSFACGACDLGSPMPTTTTLNAINAYFLPDPKDRAQMELGKLNVTSIGDTVTVCNGVACVTYTFNNSYSFIGGPPVQQVRTPPRGGSSGGSGSGGGGGYIGGGSGGGGAGGGTVVVKPPVTVKEN
jgi:uncharacterized membrane protein YgcG